MWKVVCLQMVKKYCSVERFGEKKLGLMWRSFSLVMV